MRNWFLTTIISLLMLCCTGCKFPTIIFDFSIDSGGTVRIFNEKIFSNITPSDAISGSPATVNSLVDTEPSLSINSSIPAQTLITVTTDTGQTFTQSFAMIQADASTFAPAATGTQTYAFAAQTPSDINAFLSSAASHASSTLTVDVRTQVTFQGPSDGNSHTVIGRQYSPSDGVTAVGSGSYVAPSPSTCPGQGDFPSPRNVCSD
jgi:hypothetical protein